MPGSEDEFEYKEPTQTSNLLQNKFSINTDVNEEDEEYAKQSQLQHELKIKAAKVSKAKKDAKAKEEREATKAKKAAAKVINDKKVLELQKSLGAKKKENRTYFSNPFKYTMTSPTQPAENSHDLDVNNLPDIENNNVRENILQVQKSGVQSSLYAYGQPMQSPSNNFNIQHPPTPTPESSYRQPPMNSYGQLSVSASGYREPTLSAKDCQPAQLLKPIGSRQSLKRTRNEFSSINTEAIYQANNQGCGPSQPANGGQVLNKRQDQGGHQQVKDQEGHQHVGSQKNTVVREQLEYNFLTSKQQERIKKKDHNYKPRIASLSFCNPECGICISPNCRTCQLCINNQRCVLRNCPAYNKIKLNKKKQMEKQVMCECGIMCETQKAKSRHINRGFCVKAKGIDLKNKCLHCHHEFDNFTEYLIHYCVTAQKSYAWQLKCPTCSSWLGPKKLMRHYAAHKNRVTKDKDDEAEIPIS